MGSITKKTFVVVNLYLFCGFLNTAYLAEPNKNSIINLFCLENFKAEMLKANINYDKKIAKDTCNCYLNEFSNNSNHTKAINKCKFRAKKKFKL